MSQFFSEMFYIIKVHKLSKLLLALYNILLTNVSGQVEFYTPASFVLFYRLSK